jgi:thioredoxin-related protein
MSVFFQILFLSLGLSFHALASKAKSQEMIWFEGGVEEAFKSAKTQNKPLFLYWGAVWCPPCNQMKKTVFTTSVFQQEVSQFIAVYLDGDTKAAQIWGEKLKSFSYPTMLILDPNGREISRLPTGLDAKSYVKLMSQIRNNLKSLKELIAGARQGALNESEWSMLANYSWSQDEGQNVSETELAELFNLFTEQTSKRQEFKKAHLRFFLMSLDQQKNKEDYLISNEIHLKLKSLLVDDKSVYDNREYFFYGFWDLLKKIQAKDKAKFDELSQLWLDSIHKISKRSDLSTGEKLLCILPQLQAEKDNKKVTEQLKRKLLNAVKAADKEAKDAYSRQSVMSTAIWLLTDFEMQNEAYEYALKETRRSTAPYYFMSDLGSIEKKRGNLSKSHEWHRQAWESTQRQGRATRLQWGVGYLLSLLDDDKTDLELLTKTFSEMMSDNLLNKDAFAGRNKKRLERITKSIRKSSRATELQKRFSNSFKSLCEKEKHSECDFWTKELAGVN